MWLETLILLRGRAVCHQHNSGTGVGVDGGFVQLGGCRIDDEQKWTKYYVPEVNKGVQWRAFQAT